MVFIGKCIVCVVIASEHKSNFLFQEGTEVISAVIVVIFHYVLAFLHHSVDTVFLFFLASCVLSFFGVSRISCLGFGLLAFPQTVGRYGRYG